MSGPASILDAMQEMRRIALRDGRSPRRWEINEAGLISILAGSVIDHQGGMYGLLGKPFFGVPLALMPEGPKRRSNDPKVDLIVDGQSEPYTKEKTRAES
jgi:hypothetical protein